MAFLWNAYWMVGQVRKPTCDLDHFEPFFGNYFCHVIDVVSLLKDEISGSASNPAGRFPETVAALRSSDQSKEINKKIPGLSCGPGISFSCITAEGKLPAVNRQVINVGIG